MLRPLLKLYLIVLLGGGLSFALVNYSFVRLFHERATQNMRSQMRVDEFLLKDYLDRHPGAGRAAALDTLQQLGSDDFTLLSAREVGERLNPAQLQDLRHGKLVLSLDAQDIYMPLPDGSVIRTHALRQMNLDLKLLSYSTVALATLLAVLLWIYFFWHDLRKLQVAARAFGAGALATRVNLSGKSNIYELSQQFNDMARQIEAAILHQREMMHGISHELKTPLARLEFGLALLMQSSESAQSRQDRQLALREDVRELDDLVTELLTLSSLEHDGYSPAAMRVELGKLLDSVAASAAHDAETHAVTLSITMSDAPEHHACDPKLVARALLNLIYNGVRYARSVVRVEASSGSGGALILRVDDDGPGIPDEDRARVFEPFHRLDPSRDRHTGGFGLGLAIVRRVAHVHGGEVRVETGPLGGAGFVMTLPPLTLVV